MGVSTSLFRENPSTFLYPEAGGKGGVRGKVKKGNSCTIELELLGIRMVSTSINFFNGIIKIIKLTCKYGRIY